MSADVLRKAAALMRERADLPYVKGAWETTGRYVRRVSKSPRIVPPAHASADAQLYDADRERETNEAIAQYIASWHPAVALAVADLLDLAATHEKCAGDDCGQGYGPGGRYGDIDPSCSVCGTPDEYAEPWPCEYVKRGVALATAYLSDAS